MLLLPGITWQQFSVSKTPQKSSLVFHQNPCYNRKSFAGGENPMSYLTVYLGSDHVIQQPGFEYQKNSLSVSSDPADAIRVACRRNAKGLHPSGHPHIFIENGTQTVKMQFDTFPQKI